jgi:hypothetical protein
VTTSAPPFAGLPSAHLPERLAALAALVEIAQDRSGPGGFSPELVAEGEALLARAGERLKLSAASRRCSTRWPGPTSRRRQ